MKKNKSVIIFIPSIENAGVEKNLYIIANYISKKKIPVRIITSLKPRKKFDKNIKIISLKKKSNIINSRIIKTLFTVFLFLKYFRNENAVIFSFQANIAAILLGYFFNKKVIIRSNTSPEKYIKNIFQKLIFKFFFKLADDIVVNSFQFRNSFKKKFSINPKVIYNPLVIKSSKKINFPFFKDKNALKIINVARLTDQKDHLTLLRAFVKLSEILKCKLVIIGSGYKEKILKKFILNNKLQNKVKLIGYKENPMPYIKLADVFVLSSTFEGLPNVLIEALYLKKYIISSNCPSGPKEILNDGKYGSLFKVGDDHQLFQILKKFNHNKKINYKIEQGYKSLKRFNYKINCEKYYKLILNYLN